MKKYIKPSSIIAVIGTIFLIFVIGGIIHLSPISTQNVFNKYFREHMAEVNIMNLLHGYTWLPLSPLNVNSIIDLRNVNYMTRSASIIISSMPELLEIPVAVNGMYKGYNQFYQEVRMIIISKAPNTFENVIIKHLIAMLYLRALTLQLNRYEMYSDLVSANNLVSFRNAMSRYLQMNDAELQVLFNTLKGI